MTDDTSHVSKTLDDMRSRITATLDAARTQLATLNGAEAMYGLPLTQWQELLNGTQNVSNAANPQPQPSTLTQPATAAQRRGGPVTLRPDEYLGMEPMEAAKRYMRAVGHAIAFDDITDAVQRGGAAVSGADWRDRLEISLKRSPYQVVTVAEHTYGLAEFYTEDQLKRLRDSRRAKESRPGSTKKSARTKSASGAKPKGRVGRPPKSSAGKETANDASPKAARSKKEPRIKTAEAQADAAPAAEQVH